MRKLVLIFIAGFTAANVWGQTNAFPETGNVGIGKMNPEKNLEIYSNNANEGLKLTMPNPSIWLQDNTNGNKTWSIYNQGNDDGLAFRSMNDNLSSILTRLFIQHSSGNVGIGTTSPSEKLDINGNLNMTGSDRRIYMGGVGGTTFGISYNSTYPNYGIFYTEGDPDYVSISPNGNARNGIMNIYGDGRVGIGTTSSSEKLGIAGDVKIIGTGTTIGLSNISNAWLKIGNTLGLDNNEIMFSQNAHIGTVSNNNMYFVTNGQKNMTITSGGNIGIGTTNPGSYKLAVEGVIGAHEIKVTTDNWADFVFDPDYNLMSLTELQTFIETNRHLPEIPTAKEVEEEGISVGEMNAKLLQKVEELTLYLIEKDEEIQELRKEIQEIKMNIH